MRTLARITPGALLLLAACGGEGEPAQRPPRPVSYVTLRSQAPGPVNRLAGTVESWKRVDLGFEVPGRVAHMLDAGTEVQGAAIDVNGDELAPGTVIARLDDERYRIALAEQEALHDSAQAKLKATRTELSSVLPEKLAAAKADLGLQEQQVERFTSSVAEGSAPQERLDQYEAASKVARATVAEAESLLEAKAAEVEAVEAHVRVAAEMVERARLNLRDCELVAPFHGVVARTHVITGGYVLRAQRVATVQMMDPIKVQVAVSPRLDAELDYNDRVSIHLPDSGEVLDGYVYLKDTFADPVTRTYLATLLVRNRRVQAGDVGAADAATPRATDILSLELEVSGGPGPYYAEVGCIYEDESGSYLWKAEGLTVANLAREFEQRVRVKKVRVTPGDRLLDFVQLFTFRELADHGELDPARDLVLRNVTGDVSDGDEVVLVRERWLLRPGDVVSVGLRGAGVPAGLYVPEDAIQFDGQAHNVFAIQGSADGGSVATRVAVVVGETVGKLQRIEAADGTVLSEGMQVVVGGAHYVASGEAVNLVEELVLAQ